MKSRINEDWAKREVEIACKRERGDKSEENWEEIRIDECSERVYMHYKRERNEVEEKRKDKEE